MKIIALLLVCLWALNTTAAIRIGMIRNASLSINCSYLTINASTCDECLCTMINGSQNMLVLSLNCYDNRSNVVSCKLFSTDTYDSSCFYQMDSNANSTYYFQQLPSINQSLPTVFTAMQPLTAICSPNCSNKGSCVAPGNCSCPTGLWTGSSCETPVCNAGCQNGGNCSAPQTCTCPSTYTGNFCQTPVCNSSCQNGGNCTSPGVCTCYDGWTGDYCQTVPTLLRVFDSTLNDLSSQFIGAGVNAPFFTTGINGYSSALSLNGSLSQCVAITPYLNMSYHSFTWEFWVYPTITPSGDSLFIGQCSAANTSHCLHILTRNDAMYFGFYNNDAAGTTLIPAKKWSHMAFVYDLTANKKYIYLNGTLQTEQNSAGPLQVESVIMTFGCRSFNNGSSYNGFFTGYIDQMLYNPRVKNASEILDDATLVAYYRFLSSTPLMDSGPNYINGSWGGGAVSTASGIVDQALNFPVNGSYFLITGLVLLGISDMSYSLSLWFKTTSLNGGGTLVHISEHIDGTGWCLRFMGLTSSGNIEIQGHSATNNLVFTGPVIPIGTWNHAVYTFSTANGMRLYINGTLDGSIPATYSASGVPNTLIFGNPRFGTACGSSCPNQQFYGSLDEVRLYSRELNASEVSQLYSNP